MPKSEDMEFVALVDWVEGRLSEQETRIVEKQVAADSVTRANVAWLRAFALISEATVIASPPSEVRDTLVDRFEAYAEGNSQPSLLKRLVARLTFDSDLQPALGLRATGTPESQRQFIHSTEAADVAMNVRSRPHDGLLDLDGQIFPMDSTDPGAFGVQLLEGLSEVITTATNDLGEFSFEAVPHGVYEVVASSDRVEIHITQVGMPRGK
jgi:hypothetical protein